MTRRSLRFALPALLCLLASALASASASAQAPRVRRFALVASANDGGPGRQRLRFADSDAQAISRVLAQLGGVRDADMVLVKDTDRARLRTGFERVKALSTAARQPGVRHELFVYYSGHSDEDGLLLGTDRVTYRELRSWIDEMSTDVRIAILDSCASGAFIRLKGGSRRPAFLSDDSTEARGHAFLTASSDTEAAQESDRIGAAFFTHALVAGLRGVADTDRDGRVTLNEAYRYAHAETLGRTESSRVGPQHPSYDIQLAGTGDLVLTDLRATNARLVLAPQLAGRIYVRDAAGRLLVELRKEPVYPVELGLEPGPYRVVLDADGRPFEARIELRDGARTELAQAQFVAIPVTAAVARGGGPSVEDRWGPQPAPRDYRHVPFDLVLVPGLRGSGNDGRPQLNNAVLGVVAHSDALRGFQLSLVGNVVADDLRGVQLSSGVNINYGATRGAQIGAAVNLGVGAIRGVQSAGLANLAGADVYGAQIGPVNLARGHVRGAQIGAVNGTTGDAEGVQIGAVNYTAGQREGAQIGAANHGGRGVHGAQIAVVNYGGRIAGAQIGVVNVADELDGLQIGVVNFARRGRGASLGLLPIILDGYNHLALWSSDLSAGNVGAKLGTRHFYVLLGAGLTTDAEATGDRPFSMSFGLGGHITPVPGPLFFDVDVVSTQYAGRGQWENQDRNLASLRLQVGWQLARRFAITAGPTFNVQTTWDGADYTPGLGIAQRVYREGDTTVRLFPGFVVGVQL